MNRGTALQTLERWTEALASHDKALTLRPDFVQAHINRGNVLQRLERLEEAIASYDHAIALTPDDATAHANRGIALLAAKRFAEAAASHERALALRPGYDFLAGDVLAARMAICDWHDLDARVAEVSAAAGRGEKATSPFALLAFSGSTAAQLTAARVWTAEKAAAEPMPLRRAAGGERIALGYFSADFHDHAVSRLIVELFERHDRDRFSLTAFSFGPDSDDPMRHRLRVAFDRFVDVRDKNEADIAALARDMGIDIAIDLSGFTANGRPLIFAHRAAPVQVNYLGYPGTMGAGFMDYIVADRTIIPDAARADYTEKIAALPFCYQANDSTRDIPANVPSRPGLGLPENAFVFCCFNNNYKITPAVFDIWMRLARRIEGAVFWLLADNPAAAENLRREAAARGVAPDRLVFAPRTDLASHLARHRRADLFLDTLPYNAHTTASDALWTGLPLVTQIGTSFAGRVAASLLRAIGLPELIAETPEDYEAIAFDLATNRDRLSAVKARLAANRLTAPLFDTRRFARHLESAYVTMHERSLAGLPPDHIVVQP